MAKYQYRFISFFIQDPSSSYDEDETEGLIQHDGARPSTSRGFRDDEDSSTIDERSKLIKDKDQKGGSGDEKAEKKETEAEKKRKILMAKLMRIPELISSVLVSLTLRLHRVSRSYRYVMRVLAREKKTLKVIAPKRYFN
jgi:hypothetical protein